MNGLTSDEVKKYKELYGSNELVKEKQQPFIKLFLNSLGDPMIKILLIALAVKVVFLFSSNDWFETLGILIAIFIASFISSISEYGSSKAFESLLEKNSALSSTVLRNGTSINILNDDIVVNDIVYLKDGDIVPADGYILKGDVLVNESLLNGESNEIFKSSVVNVLKENNKLYRGTIITNNNCFMKVLSVGLNTVYGKIAKDLQVNDEISPLKYKLNHLAKIISKIGYIGAGFVFISYMINTLVLNTIIVDSTVIINSLIEALTLAVAIIIVSVPEGLPMMIALVLSTNMKKMIKNNVIVRKMVGIETAGSMNYLVFDKTGTITEGIMNVIAFIDPIGNVYNSEIELLKYNNYYHLVANLMVLNNDALNGNSTDKALYNFIDYQPLEKIVKHESFSSDKKYSTVYTKNRIYYKGASEVLINKCSKCVDKDLNINKINRLNVSKFVNSYAKKGFRIICFAYQDIGSNDIVYAGFAVISDKIKSNAVDSIRILKDAGINMIMITGDSIETALSISKNIGMYNDGDVALTSDDLNKLTDIELMDILLKIKIIARAKPDDKKRIVKFLKDIGNVVGMTGDGVNDASALKFSSVGFAMGSGSDVAKNAADIIILDDNLMSISKAVLFGRTIFENIRKFIIFQLTMNICAMFLSIVGPFTIGVMPVTSMQMLWINMIMDTLAALAFAYESPLDEYMKRKPLINEHIINKYMYNEIIFTGLFSSIVCLLFLKLPIFEGIIRYDIEQKYFLTGFFALFVFIGIFNAFNARTNNINLFNNMKKNPMFIIIFGFVSVLQIIFIYFGKDIFRTYGLTIKELFIVLGIALCVIPFDLLRKKLIK